MGILAYVRKSEVDGIGKWICNRNKLKKKTTISDLVLFINKVIIKRGAKCQRNSGRKACR